MDISKPNDTNTMKEQIHSTLPHPHSHSKHKFISPNQMKPDLNKSIPWKKALYQTKLYITKPNETKLNQYNSKKSTLFHQTYLAITKLSEIWPNQTNTTEKKTLPHPHNHNPNNPLPLSFPYHSSNLPYPPSQYSLTWAAQSAHSVHC